MNGGWNKTWWQQTENPWLAVIPTHSRIENHAHRQEYSHTCQPKNRSLHISFQWKYTVWVLTCKKKKTEVKELYAIVWNDTTVM